jgi:hypothetical protein
VRQLRKLPAQQLGSAAVQQLLQAAVTCGSGECVRQLRKLPSVQQLDSEAVQQLLLAPGQCGHDECLRLLRRLSLWR